MELKEIQAFFEEKKDDKDVQKFIAGLNPVDLDRVKDYLENDKDAIKWFQAERDRAVTKGIETYKEKTLPNILKEETEKIRAELNPKETEADKKIREQDEALKQLKADLKKKDLLNLAFKTAKEKNLPDKIIDRFVGEDEETTLKNIDLLDEVYNKGIEMAVEETFKNNGRKPHQNVDTKGDFFTQDQLRGLTPEQLKDPATLEKANASLARLK